MQMPIKLETRMPDFLFFVGIFNLRWSTFKEPPLKWLDRPIDSDHVEELVSILRDNPCSMMNNQLWLGVCQIPKDGIMDAADVKGCEITIIGGLHRKRAYEKVRTILFLQT